MKRLLEDSLKFHEAHNDIECPVCGGRPLDNRWREETLKEVDRLGRETKAAARAVAGLESARQRVMGILSPVPDILLRAEDSRLDVAQAVEAWHQWASLRDALNTAEIADQLVQTHPPLQRAVESLRDEAKAKLDQAQQAWRPLASRVGDWIGRARGQADRERDVQRLSRAENWIKEASTDLRKNLFTPLATAVAATHDRLTGGGATALLPPELTGSKTRRRVDLEYSMSGHQRPVEGVMSHGEANVVGLSVFFPPASRSESPFRFVVIDDPVQALDGIKIEGLARVLDSVASTRQVIVFTHDPRLSAAIRTFRIDANHIEIARNADSVVTCRLSSDAVSRHIDHAKAALNAGSLPESARRVAVAGFLRQAVEAKCEDVFTRCQVKQGKRYDDVATVVHGDWTTKQWLSLAVFQSGDRPKEVAQWIGTRLGPPVVEAVNHLNEAAHADLDESVDLQKLFLHSQSLIDELSK